MPSPKTRLIGLAELKRNINDVKAAFSNDDSISVESRSSLVSSARSELRNGLYDAAVIVRNQARANAVAAGWPHKAIESAFAFNRPSDEMTKRTRALAGVGKRKSMVEWTAAEHQARFSRVLQGGVHKVAPGGKVAMSLAAMFEFGTSRMVARPAWRPALTSTRSNVRNKVRETYTAVLKMFDSPPLSD